MSTLVAQELAPDQTTSRLALNAIDTTERPVQNILKGRNALKAMPKISIIPVRSCVRCGDVIGYQVISSTKHVLVEVPFTVFSEDAQSSLAQLGRVLCGMCGNHTTIESGKYMNIRELIIRAMNF